MKALNHLITTESSTRKGRCFWISQPLPPTRCYFCHSSQDLNISESEVDQDECALSAGLTQIAIGTEGSPDFARFSEG